MKTIVLILLAAFGMNVVEAQNVSFQWSQVSEFKNESEKFLEILCFDGNATYLLKKDDKNYRHFIEKYDANLKLIYSTEVLMPTEDARFTSKDFAGALVLNGKAYFFLNVWHIEKKENTVWAVELDDKGIESKRIELSTFPVEKRGKIPDYTYVASPDRTKMAAIGVYPFEKEETEKWHTIMFDAVQGKVTLDKKELDTQVPQERFEVNEVLLTNSGSLHSFKIWDVKKMGQFSAFVTVTPDGQVKRTDTDMGGKGVASRKVFLNKDGQASAVGILSVSEKPYDGLGGHYYFTVDDKGNKVKCAYEPFNEAVFRIVYSEDKAKKEGQSIDRDYRLVHYVEGAQGEITLFIEKFTADSKSLPKPANAPTGPVLMEYTYEQGQLIAIRLDNKGHRLWASGFNKKQKYKTERSGAYWGGIVPLMGGDNTYFLWNYLDFPLIPRTGLAIPGWIDAAGKKHTLDEYGGRMIHPTCLSGYDENGNVLFADNPVQYAIPMLEMYKGAIYNVSFTSDLYGSNGNKVLLIMEMFGGAAKGQAKYQLCVVTVN